MQRRETENLVIAQCVVANTLSVIANRAAFVHQQLLQGDDHTSNFVKKSVSKLVKKLGKN